MTIELCTFVYKFQLRYWWVLSSLFQQVNPPDLLITTDLCQDDQFLNVDKIKQTFGSKLNLKFNMHTKEEMDKRGFIRSKNVKNASTDWICFLDADDVFAPDFFAKLNDVINGLTEAQKNQIISTPRLTMPPASGYSLINSVSYDSIIPDAYATVNAIKTHWSVRGRCNGAGFMQLCHVPTMRQRNIHTYVEGAYDVNLLSSSKYYRMKSDMVFRRKFDSILPIRSLPPLIHLNHYRREKDPQFDTIDCH